MRIMTLEELLRVEDDNTLLAIYKEIETCIVPASGYARGFCRRVNRMIDAGKLCISPTSYRKVYLPTLSKMLTKELSRRYAQYCYNMKEEALFGEL